MRGDTGIRFNAFFSVPEEVVARELIFKGKGAIWKRYNRFLRTIFNKKIVNIRQIRITTPQPTCCSTGQSGSGKGSLFYSCKTEETETVSDLMQHNTNEVRFPRRCVSICAEVPICFFVVIESCDDIGLASCEVSIGSHISECLWEPQIQ